MNPTESREKEENRHAGVHTSVHTSVRETLLRVTAISGAVTMVTGRRKLCPRGAFNTSEEHPPPTHQRFSTSSQTRDGAAEPLWPGSQNSRASKWPNYRVFMERQLSPTAAGRIR